jgi:hypothetical protein
MMLTYVIDDEVNKRVGKSLGYGKAAFKAASL